MDEVRARVIIQQKGLYTINYEGEERLAEVSGKFRYETKDNTDYPAVGDYVLSTWPNDGSHCIISSLFPRKSVFIRKAAGVSNEQQVVAANIDIVFVCMSLNQDYNIRRLERYVVATWDSGATPVIVLTKADLCDCLEDRIKEVSEAIIGVDTIITSSEKGEIAEVYKYLQKGKTVAFVGSSGVGKSTLINKLCGGEKMKTSEIRTDDDKGRHTTTHRELITLECGAYVIDTPGIRELGLVNNEEGLQDVFSDIEDMIAQCRFSNCRHINEPGCKIREALESGNLSMDRWNSYQKLIAENAYNSDSAEYLRAKKEKFKAIAKANRVDRTY